MCTAGQVQVVLMPSRIEVRMGMRSPLKGQLWAEVKVEDSTWYVQDGLLSMQLLKRNRRGHYANGSNNAETFWMSVRFVWVAHTCSSQRLLTGTAASIECLHWLDRDEVDLLLPLD